MNVNLQEIINKLQTAKGELQKQQRFAQFATGLDELISHTSEPLMLMVMGSFSTGKSSFINALVGEEIAAVEAKPTTAVVTKLCYGQQDKLLLHFRDGKVQSATPQEFTRMTAVNDEEKFNEVHEKLDYVERQMPLEILKQVSIIDSPGLNDVKEKRSEATERFVSKADTVLWMFSVVQLATREEIAAMDRLTPRLKPIAVVNKMDLLDEEEDDPAEFLAKARQTLNGRVQAVVGISAKYELEGKKENNALKREIGNFAELEKAVADLVLPHREKFKLNTLLDELGAYFAAFNREFAKAKEENEAKKSRSYEQYMENSQAFMQTEDILNGVTSGILDYCEREAGQNNEQALYLLGVLYEGGIGVLQDTNKALQFYQKAAMKNHQDAMINLYAYYSNHGNDDTANYWLKKLAEQGLSEAQNAYADKLSNAERYKEAVQWYERAAKQGYAPAQAHLVENYIYGVGVETDYNIARQWCDKAAEQYYPVAQYFMAKYFVKNQVDRYAWYRKAAEQDYAKAQNMVARYLVEGWGGVTKNQIEAVEWYRRAATQGYALAQYNLAIFLANGKGCAKNQVEAVEWYRKAAEQGHAQAQDQLAYCLDVGIGCTADKAEALKWYKKAAEKNIANAQNMVGRYLEEGWGAVEKSEEEAVEWFRKAAENGYAVAQNNLGNCLYSGRGCTQNYQEAVAWYRKAAEQGHAQAQTYLADCLDEGIGCAADKAEAFQWYKKAADQGYSYAQYNLAICLAKREGCAKNKAEAFQWFRKAAEQNVDEAQYAVGLYYEQGLGNLSKNETEAVKWYRKAAEQGHADAQDSLANCLNNGIGCAADKAEAFQWYKKAAEKNIAHAQNMVGRYLVEGWGGVTKNQIEAVEWYRRAATQGYAPAQYNLGVMLETGEGCAVDEDEAEKWYRKAAEQGIKEAQEALVSRRNSDSTSTQVAAQSSGCLLPILVTLALITLMIAF
jgi:TPR repeat protein/GTP-binding protein EngB required for normal cell division